MSRATMSLRDYSNEMTTTTVNGVALTSANFDAQTTQWTALRAAIQGLTLGVTAQQSLSQFAQLSGATPSDPFAQREVKWLVNYHDAVTNKKYQTEIGTADLGDDHLVAGSDMADLTSADWVAFISAFEAFVRAPDNIANGVVVDSAYFVGRRS